ncbi:MAG: hypothetical protein LQ342_004616 [Letrouitia transgressa]|nr:MAG: hypothetical protein LQ342_004616 [Letrouitia transgressa]
MEASPLTQQNRPGPFQSKIDYLYEELLKGDSDIALTNGFWKEFFLLRPNTTKLRQRLEDFSADDLLQIQDETQQLFARAVAEAKSGNGVSDEFALDTLTVFLGSVLVKRYTNPSSEIITVLAGLDEVDYVFSDFANTLESIVRTGSSRKPFE